MVQDIQKSLVVHRKRILPVLIGLALLAGLIVSLVSTPNAQADYFKGCGYGYNSSGTVFGYGTNYGYGYNSSGSGFGYGNGDQVCPNSGGGGGGGGGGSTGTTTTTTTAPTTPVTTTTTTTTPPRLYTSGAKGFAEPGKTLSLTIFGAGFHGNPRITSNEAGTSVIVIHDNGTSLVIRITVKAGSRSGEHTLTIRFADGRTCKVNYSVK